MRSDSGKARLTAVRSFPAIPRCGSAPGCVTPRTTDVIAARFPRDTDRGAIPQGHPAVLGPDSAAAFALRLAGRRPTSARDEQ